MFDGEQTRMTLGRATMTEAVRLAWMRFSRGLPTGIGTIEEAITSGARTLEQWNTCMDTATHLMRCSDSHARSRVAIRKPDSIPRKVLQSLETFFTLQRDADPEDDRNLSQRFGQTWLQEQRSPILRVPSAVIPWEHNYLLNPRHPQAARVRVCRKDLFRLDPRLIR